MSLLNMLLRNHLLCGGKYRRSSAEGRVRHLGPDPAGIHGNYTNGGCRKIDFRVIKSSLT